MHWEIHPPRPSRFPSGGDFALGQSLGPRGAKSPPSGNLSGLGGCISQYIPPLGSVRIQYSCRHSSCISFVLSVARIDFVVVINIIRSDINTSQQLTMNERKPVAWGQQPARPLLTHSAKRKMPNKHNSGSASLKTAHCHIEAMKCKNADRLCFSFASAKLQ